MDTLLRALVKGQLFSRNFRLQILLLRSLLLRNATRSDSNDFERIYVRYEFDNIVPLFRIGYFHQFFSQAILRFPVHGVLGFWAIQGTFHRFYPLKYTLFDGIFTIFRCRFSRMSGDTISSSLFWFGRCRSERFVLNVKISLGTIRRSRSSSSNFFKLIR